MLSSITVLRRDHKRNRNENEVGKRMERGGEKNAKRVRKKKRELPKENFRSTG